MQTEENPKIKIAFVGKFNRLHDEEYIARSFEMLGHEVIRIPPHTMPNDIAMLLGYKRPDILLYCKWDYPPQLTEAIKKAGTKTVCWLFDLYFDYQRELQVKTRRFFRSDYVFTTDGGHDKLWPKFGINHQCIRQGIYKEECFMLPTDNKYDVAFVGSESPLYDERNKTMKWASENFDFRWFGRHDTEEIRGIKLNKLFSETKIIIGNSVYSPHYWSNRIVETLGRGGFLIHQEVEGLREEYPHLVTYKRGDLVDLKSKIEYYLTHEKEREEIRVKNFEWVRDNYTMDKKCAELISKL